MTTPDRVRLRPRLRPDCVHDLGKGLPAMTASTASLSYGDADAVEPLADCVHDCVQRVGVLEDHNGQGGLLDRAGATTTRAAQP